MKKILFNQIYQILSLSGKDKTSKLEFILKGYHLAYATKTQKFLYCHLTHWNFYPVRIFVILSLIQWSNIFIQLN